MSSPNAKAATLAKRPATTELSRRMQKAAKKPSDSPEPESDVVVPSRVGVCLELGLTWIRTLRSIGKACEIDGDGNCGCSASQRGLEEHGDIEKDTAIGEFRRGLFRFATGHYEMFCGESPRYFGDGGLQV
uniref:Uncharacterized protein n=1 Tax=Minutocellus polymorphus TaxID=265543 RepID=A0A7S0AZD7_9STRA|mmetsp:Transcript_7598/g.12577  ORF Transcript_7598/g.12577 Transcript_7598/m.12577 type:complete len:131 (+) Transcript_7598:119-511(+)